MKTVEGMLSNRAATTMDDELNIANYIIGGGKFWLIGQDAIYSGVTFTFLQTNFHLASYVEDYLFGGLLTHIQGLDEVAGDAFVINEDYEWNDFNPDDLTPNADAHHIIIDVDFTQHPAILSNDSTTSFWAIDGRGPYPYETWEQLVHDMLLVFGITSIQERPYQEPAAHLQLHISPDPFVHSTTINYNIPIAGNVKLQIFDKSGRHIITLIDEYKKVGSHKINWHGKDAKGVKISSGVYFIRLICGELIYSKSLVLSR